MKKVSIIIPNFNRAHLIGETLDSIIGQTYLNWECIIVDDHSTDDSREVIQRYVAKDHRFSIVSRPNNRLKGANACRNYGFELSKGDYINWFDSDDLMTTDHIQLLVAALENHKADFAVGDAQNFIEGKGLTDRPYVFDRNTVKMSASNFGKVRMGWITDDFLAKKQILTTTYFNEKFRTAGDEYNFFTQLLHKNNNGVFVNSILTHRRVHDDALTSTKGLNKLQENINVAEIKFYTFLDIEKFNDKDLIYWFLSGYMNYSFRIAEERQLPPYFYKSLPKISRHFGFRKMLYYALAIGSNYIFKKGYWFLNKAKLN
ncbi:MAG: glycosyltransferase involved in cell wall biosynthesis [Flavobacteriaceae bacterium]